MYDQLSHSFEYISDVDGDNITDGKEIKGYWVKIITGWKSDGTPISRMRFISPSELDPLTPYANATGEYLDGYRDDVHLREISQAPTLEYMIVFFPNHP